MLERWTADNQFGVRVPEGVLRKIRRCCRRAHPIETGGVLVGKYTPAHDCALVLAACGPPLDSKAGLTWFQRGTRHLQRWLNLRWNKLREHYVGEWHYHPSAEPNPSGRDREQMRKFARNLKLRCPEPLLLIVGGDEHTGYRVSCYVSPRGLPLESMHPPSKNHSENHEMRPDH